MFYPIYVSLRFLHEQLSLPTFVKLITLYAFAAAETLLAHLI